MLRLWFYLAWFGVCSPDHYLARVRRQLHSCLAVLEVADQIPWPKRKQRG